MTGYLVTQRGVSAATCSLKQGSPGFRLPALKKEARPGRVEGVVDVVISRLLGIKGVALDIVGSLSKKEAF